MSDYNAAFSRGFVLGQTSAYVEQVTAGAKLAAQIGCSRDHLVEVRSMAQEFDCETLVEEREHDRVAVWIFRQPFVRSLIEQISKETTLPTAAGVWSMGKLFGYSDAEIGAYLKAHGLITSASVAESSPHLYLDKNGSRTERERCPC